MKYKVADFKFDLKPFNTNQEKDLLLYVALNDEYDLDIVLNILGFEVKEETSSFIKKLLLLKLRAISVSDIINIHFTCEKCKRRSEGTLDISSIFEISSKIKETEILKEVYSDNIDDYFKIEVDELELEEYDEYINYIQGNKADTSMKIGCKCLLCSEDNQVSISDTNFIVKNMSETKLESLFKLISNLVYSGHYTKLDVDSMVPFEREIYVGLLNQKIEELNKK